MIPGPRSDLIAQEWNLRLCQPGVHSKFRKNTSFPLGRRSRSVKNIEWTPGCPRLWRTRLEPNPPLRIARLFQNPVKKNLVTARPRFQKGWELPNRRAIPSEADRPIFGTATTEIEVVRGLDLDHL